MRLLLLLVGCAAAVRSPSPAPISEPAERPLIPEDVGLPANPEPEPRAITHEPVIGTPHRVALQQGEPYRVTPERPTGFYDLKECRPARGCKVRREVTRDYVRTELSCPKRGSGVTLQPLRRLTLDKLTFEPMHRDPRAQESAQQQADVRNDQGRVRSALNGRRDLLMKCLADVDQSTTIEIAAVIDHRKHPVAVNAARAPDDNRACIENTILAIDFPVHKLSTIVARWEFVVEDPEPYAKKPLECTRRDHDREELDPC